MVFFICTGIIKNIPVRPYLVMNTHKMKCANHIRTELTFWKGLFLFFKHQEA
jgi:hypothetical protein